MTSGFPRHPLDADGFSSNPWVYNALLHGSRAEALPRGYVDVGDTTAALVTGLYYRRLGRSGNLIVGPRFELAQRHYRLYRISAF